MHKFGCIQRLISIIGAFATLSLAMLPPAVLGETEGIDPRAEKLLAASTTYLSGQQQFSVHTQNTLEDLLESGQRVDYDVSADVIVSRPGKLRAERKGDLLDQAFYYDGKELTLSNPSEAVYATTAAPGTIEGMLDFARASLGLLVPAADLVYRNAFPLLMEHVTFAHVVGKSVVAGVRCDHLVFSRPGVDFQVWIADDGPPLPYKYVVTDTGSPARLSVSTVMSNWKTGVSVAAADFSFTPPAGVQRVEFMRRDASGTPGH